MSRVALSPAELDELGRRIAAHTAELGFQQLGVAGIDLADDARNLEAWLAAGLHGEMDFMSRHGRKRTHPEELVPGTLRVLSLRMDCQTPDGPAPFEVLADGTRAYIARYALGRDYHHIVRPRLQKLADRIAADIGPFGYRAFVDSAPVLEKPLARNAGLGWIGKHTNLINERAGSMFVLGELFTDLPLPTGARGVDRCGSCSACLPACPTGAIVAPYRLDARRCISYLTIEYHGSIPPEFRHAIGNRIFGCDDCQLVCPWNKFARRAGEPGFRARHGLEAPDAATLFGWNESDYLRRTEGSALRRLGYWRWLRNLAIALGNAPPSPTALAALQARADFPHEIVREHVAWAIGEQRRKAAAR